MQGTRMGRTSAKESDEWKREMDGEWVGVLLAVMGQGIWRKLEEDTGWEKEKARTLFDMSVNSVDWKVGNWGREDGGEACFTGIVEAAYMLAWLVAKVSEGREATSLKILADACNSTLCVKAKRIRDAYLGKRKGDEKKMGENVFRKLVTACNVLANLVIREEGCVGKDAEARSVTDLDGVICSGVSSLFQLAAICSEGGNRCFPRDWRKRKICVWGWRPLSGIASEEDDMFTADALFAINQLILKRHFERRVLERNVVMIKRLDKIISEDVEKMKREVQDVEVISESRDGGPLTLSLLNIHPSLSPVTGEAKRGAKDGRSVATTVYCIALKLTIFCSSLRSSPSLIPTLFAIRFGHRSETPFLHLVPLDPTPRNLRRVRIPPPRGGLYNGCFTHGGSR